MNFKHVVMIVADDWSPLAGCYGVPTIQTPHIDRLAAGGLRFDRAYCPTPTCAASRACMLTGLYSHQHRQYGHTHGAHHFRTRADAVSLPAVLNAHGVATTLVGKSHIAPQEVYPFATWAVPTGSEAPLFSNLSLGELLHRSFTERSVGRSFTLVASGYPHRTEGTFDRSVHGAEFQDQDVNYAPAEVSVPAFLPDTPEVRTDLADYYRFVSRFDALVGVILGEIEQAGEREETLVMVLSDHGMPFPGAKASPFEAGHHCPLVVAHLGERAAQARSCDAVVNWCDLMPTVLEALGVPPTVWPAGLAGKSLLPLLDDSDAAWRDVVFDSHSFHEVTNYFPYRAVRGMRYKYLRCLASDQALPLGTDLFDSASYGAIRQTGGAAARPHERLRRHWPEALFDLQEDPHELVNLIDEPDLAEVVQDYRARLMRWRIETRDPWLEIDYQEGRLPTRPAGKEAKS